MLSRTLKLALVVSPHSGGKILAAFAVLSRPACLVLTDHTVAVAHHAVAGGATPAVLASAGTGAVVHIVPTVHARCGGADVILATAAAVAHVTLARPKRATKAAHRALLDRSVVRTVIVTPSVGAVILASLTVIVDAARRVPTGHTTPIADGDIAALASKRVLADAQALGVGCASVEDACLAVLAAIDTTADIKVTVDATPARVTDAFSRTAPGTRRRTMSAQAWIHLVARCRTTSAALLRHTCARFAPLGGPTWLVDAVNTVSTAHNVLAAGASIAMLASTLADPVRHLWGAVHTARDTSAEVDLAVAARVPVIVADALARHAVCACYRAGFLDTRFRKAIVV